MSDLILEARKLGFSHGGLPLFEAVNLRLHAGRITALIGASGCGKSSLLRVLAGLAPAQAGELLFQGQVLRAPHPRAGLLFQQPGLLPWLSAAGNVGFGLDFKHQPRLARAERAARVAQALEAVGLSEAARRYPAQLSGGMTQRVALARALARQPLLLLADEPFSALDPITRAEMQALLRRLVQQSHSATLLVTHDVDEALALADQILLLGQPGTDQPARLLRHWPAGGDPSETRRQILQALQASQAQRYTPSPAYPSNELEAIA